VQSKQTPKHNAAEQTWLKVQTDAAQAEKQQQQQHQQRQRQRRLKNELTFKLRISLEFRFIQFVYTVRNIPNRICKTASQFEKEIFNIGRRSSRSLQYAECGILRCCFVENGKEINKELQSTHKQPVCSLPLRLRFAYITP